MAKRQRIAVEMMRTCQRCKAVWYAPYVDDRTIKSLMLDAKGHRMSASGSRMTLGGGRRAASHELRARRSESLIQEVMRWRMCPSCNSQSFTEQMVPIGGSTSQAGRSVSDARIAPAPVEPPIAERRPVPSPPPPTPRLVEEGETGWRRDPTGKYPLRWWKSGVGWTARVRTKAGIPLDDPTERNFPPL